MTRANCCYIIVLECHQIFHPNGTNLMMARSQNAKWMMMRYRCSFLNYHCQSSYMQYQVREVIFTIIPPPPPNIHFNIIIIVQWPMGTIDYRILSYVVYWLVMPEILTVCIEQYSLFGLTTPVLYFVTHSHSSWHVCMLTGVEDAVFWRRVHGRSVWSHA